MVSRIQSVIHALRYCSLHRIQSSFKFKCDRTTHVTIVVVRCFSLSLCSACVCVCAFLAPPNECQPCLHTQHTKRFILYTRAHSDSKRSLGDGSSTGKNMCRSATSACSSSDVTAKWKIVHDKNADVISRIPFEWYTSGTMVWKSRNQLGTRRFTLPTKTDKTKINAPRQWHTPLPSMSTRRQVTTKGVEAKCQHSADVLMVF